MVRKQIERLEERAVPAIINVDATAQIHAIDPRIYGVAFASTAQLNDLNVPLNRYGGNTSTRYNWQANADNRASDWYFQSLPYSSATPGEMVDTFIQNSRNGQADPMVTIPMAGYVAKLGPGRSRLSSYSIAKYGPQTGNDWQWYPDAGNGVQSSTGVKITWNDPTDANVVSDAAFQQGWMQHLVSKWGSSDKGGVRYYFLDNEPSIWHETHRDIHPNGAGMDEILTKTLAYSGMIKSVDPTGYVMGPEEFGWSGYWISGMDLKYGGETNDWGNLPDKKAHGGADYLPWVLQQLKANDQKNNTRTLDAFTLHYYPQANEFSNDVTNTMQLLRNRSTRSLWDTSYVDQSWIGTGGQPDGGIVKLIPRMRQWADGFYLPETDIGITEYNWGAEGHTNGATTQADIWGIFGRENLDLANRWTTPNTNTPTYLAMKLWRNYDGVDHGFGDVSAMANVENPDQVSAYVSRRSSDGALTVVVINKNLYNSSTPNAKTPVTINLNHFAHLGIAQHWRLAATSPSNQTAASITQHPNVTISGNSLSFNADMQSVSMFVIAPATQPAPTFTSQIDNGTAQRSRVGSVTLTFSELVTIGPGSLTLRRTGPGGTTSVIPVSVDTSLSTGTQTIARLAFSGASVQNGSLIDGNYMLNVESDLVLDTGGRSMAGDVVLNFHRLFGDSDGNRTVNASDFAAFRSVFGTGSSIFDFNNDGQTNASDFAEFRARFGVTLEI